MKVMIVFGTRPEAIKMCPLVIEIQKRAAINLVVCLTGQHGEMLDQVMDVFGIKADYNLSIMREGQTLSMITEGVLHGVQEVLFTEQPDILLVHGDTTTSYAAALAAFYQGTPVGHVEAGLRTYDMRAPFPEEFNRQSVDLISDMMFAPTESAKQNLLHEGKREKDIWVTGNTVIDALKTTIKDNYEDEYLDWAKGSRLVLLTAHRRENLNNLQGMFRGIVRALERYSDVKCLYPVHRNPVVRRAAEKAFSDFDKVRLIDPLDVLTFHNYMSRSYLIVTDSGGIQEEAPSIGIPVLVMRNNTERPEGIEAGTVRLIGTDEESVYYGVNELLGNRELYDDMSNSVNPYGDGYASTRIVDALCARYI